jgi:Zn-dependent protease
MLAEIGVDFRNPLLWALMIGWIMTVVLHEFAHGLVAFWGGDYTIQERGGLTLNPLQYIDPMMSIVLPIVFLAMGGIPLPGGATYVRRDLLRSRFWDCAVSAAGPAMNLLIFLLLCIPLHPRVGWIPRNSYILGWTDAQIFVAGLAFSQILSVILNLFPIPPLDGFGIISPFLPHDVRVRAMTPPWNSILFFGFFLVLWRVPGVMIAIENAIGRIFDLLGMDSDNPINAFTICLYGRHFR